MHFAVIGTGVLGTALAVRLSRAGFQCVGINTRSESSYRRFCTYLSADKKELTELLQTADLIFITTRDEGIAEVAAELSGKWTECGGRQGQVWVHCSGALPAHIMQIDEEIPVQYLSVHPLQAFADIPMALKLLPGCHFGLEGDCPEVGQRIVTALGGISHDIREGDKALYHAGAVVASNFLVALASAGTNLLNKAGVNEEDALRALLPLMKGTLANLETLGLPLALTGPIARGDAAVVAEHLKHMPPEVKVIYQVMSRETLKVAEASWQEKGLTYPVPAARRLKELTELKSGRKVGEMKLNGKEKKQ